MDGVIIYWSLKESIDLQKRPDASTLVGQDAVPPAPLLVSVLALTLLCAWLLAMGLIHVKVPLAV